MFEIKSVNSWSSKSATKTGNVDLRTSAVTVLTINFTQQDNKIANERMSERMTKRISHCVTPEALLTLPYRLLVTGILHTTRMSYVGSVLYDAK